MPDFNNLSELSKYVESNFGKLMTPENVEGALLQATKRLEELLRQAIDDYYNDSSMEPKEYDRTYNWLRSVMVDPKPIINGNIIEMQVTFDDTLANHMSAFNSKNETYEDGFVPILMNEDVHINWSRPYRIPRLSDRDGIHYIEKTLQQFNEENVWGFQVGAIMTIDGVEKYIYA